MDVRYINFSSTRSYKSKLNNDFKMNQERQFWMVSGHGAPTIHHLPLVLLGRINIGGQDCQNAFNLVPTTCRSFRLYLLLSHGCRPLQLRCMWTCVVLYIPTRSSTWDSRRGYWPGAETCWSLVNRRLPGERRQWNSWLFSKQDMRF